MSDLIRKSDALRLTHHWNGEDEAYRAIAALPAVTVGEPVAHAYIVDGECEQIEWGAEYCLPDDPALTMLYAHPAPAPAAIREAALREARQRVNDLVAERQSDLHGARNDFNRGAVDALQEACAAILALIPKGAAK